MARRETRNNAYPKFWSVKQRVLWHVMEHSVVVNIEKWPESLGVMLEF